MLAISVERLGSQGPTRFIPNATLPVRQARPPSTPRNNASNLVHLSREAADARSDATAQLKLRLFGETSPPKGLALSKTAQDMSVLTYQFLQRMYPKLNAERALMQGLKDLCPDSHEHCERVGDLAYRLARELDLDGDEADELERELDDSADLKEAGFLALTIAALDDSEMEVFLEDTTAAGEFHDIGKLAIPDDILSKPGSLTEEEYEIVKLHPLIGETMLTPIELPDSVRSAVRSHHECWDGTGYPDGLRGKEIPLPARILAIVDSFDAMTAGRPYRGTLTYQAAVDEIMAHAGTQFDPFLAEIFAQMIARLEPEIEV